MIISEPRQWANKCSISGYAIFMRQISGKIGNCLNIRYPALIILPYDHPVYPVNKRFQDPQAGGRFYHKLVRHIDGWDAMIPESETVIGDDKVNVMLFNKSL